MAKLTVSVVVDAPLEKVWEAMWKPEHIVNWCFAGDDWCSPWAKGESPKIGEVFTTRMEAKDGSFGFDMAGQYTSVEPMKGFSYTMGEMKEYFLDAGRVVDVIFEATPEGVKVSETFDAEEIHSTEQQVSGWQSILDHFKKYVESIK